MSCSFEMVKDEIGNRKYILTISNGDIKEFKTLYSLLRYINNKNINLEQ